MGVGLISLFAMPTAEGLSFRDARMLLEMLGGDWLLWLAWLGVSAAILGALFLKPDSPYHRNLLITVGPLLGLAIPLAIRIHLYGMGDSDDGPFMGWLGRGPLLFAASCLIASVIGLGTYVISVLLALGLGALVILPAYAHAYYVGGDRPGLNEVREVIGQEYQWMFWLALVGVIVALVSSLLNVRTGRVRPEIVTGAGSAAGLLILLGMLLTWQDAWDSLDILLGPGPLLFSYFSLCATAISLSYPWSANVAADEMPSPDPLPGVGSSIQLD
jgi:hypothetical protein